MRFIKHLCWNKNAIDVAACAGAAGRGWGVRHLQALMLFTGLLLAFSMRVNMSMAIVAMTDPTDPNSFDWSGSVQSVILSSYFWGYVVLQVPGGEVAARCGGKALVAGSLGVNSAVCLVLPLAAYYGGWQTVCACRVLQGLTQGCIFPSFHHLIGKWAPLEEKSRLGTFIYAGAQLGTALQQVVSGVVAGSWGWPAIFYLNGALGAVWTALYVFVGANSPQSCGYIGHAEKDYIQTSLGQLGEPKKLRTPWKKMFTSWSFISLIIVHCGQNWGFWTLMTEMPSYFSLVLGVDIKSNGVLSALPYLAMFLLSFPFGFMADYALRKQWLGISAVRKISNSIGHYGPAVALIGLSYSPAGNVAVAAALLTLVVGLNAGHYTGYMLVHIDMAPNFAGTMMGITNCIASGLSIATPLVAGAILTDQTSAAEWRNVFYLSSVIYIIGNTIFLIFGTSERQQWNEVDDSTTDDEKSEKNKM